MLGSFKIPLDPPLKRGIGEDFFTVKFAVAKIMHIKTKVGLLYKKTIKN
jgi:hypothetical protein